MNHILTPEVTCMYTLHIHSHVPICIDNRGTRTMCTRTLTCAVVMVAIVLSALHVLQLSKSHPTASLTCFATSIRIQLNHKNSNCLFNKDPGHRELQGDWQVGEVIEDPGSFHLSAHHPQC